MTWLRTKEPTIQIDVSQSIMQVKNSVSHLVQVCCSWDKALIAIIWCVFTICNQVYHIVFTNEICSKTDLQ